MAHRVLGIDPGLQLTGYGLVELPSRRGALEPALVEAGVIRLKPREGIAQRLGRLHAELDTLLEGHRPDVLVVEKLYAHYAHPRTAILMAHARGAILLAAEQRGLEVVDLPATEVKKAVTGYGHASKHQIQRAVQRQFSLPSPPDPPDVADALAVALCHARRVLIDRL